MPDGENDREFEGKMIFCVIKYINIAGWPHSNW
jgi:hypothetical protein